MAAGVLLRGIVVRSMGASCVAVTHEHETEFAMARVGCGFEVHFFREAR
jgi:hypothetical protein